MWWLAPNAPRPEMPCTARSSLATSEAHEAYLAWPYRVEGEPRASARTGACSRRSLPVPPPRFAPNLAQGPHTPRLGRLAAPAVALLRAVFGCGEAAAVGGPGRRRPMGHLGLAQTVGRSCLLRAAAASVWTGAALGTHCCTPACWPAATENIGPGVHPRGRRGGGSHSWSQAPLVLAVWPSARHGLTLCRRRRCTVPSWSSPCLLPDQHWRRGWDRHCGTACRRDVAGWWPQLLQCCCARCRGAGSHKRRLRRAWQLPGWRRGRCHCWSALHHPARAVL